MIGIPVDSSDINERFRDFVVSQVEDEDYLDNPTSHIDKELMPIFEMTHKRSFEYEDHRPNFRFLWPDLRKSATNGRLQEERLVLD